jgi:hypothetical protein
MTWQLAKVSQKLLIKSHQPEKGVKLGMSLAVKTIQKVGKKN